MAVSRAPTDGTPGDSGSERLQRATLTVGKDYAMSWKVEQVSVK